MAEYTYTVNNKTCKLRDPNFDELEMYQQILEQYGSTRAHRVILNKLWLEGDEEIKSKTRLFKAVEKQMQRDVLSISFADYEETDNDQFVIKIKRDQLDDDGNILYYTATINEPSLEQIEKMESKRKYPLLAAKELFEEIKTECDPAINENAKLLMSVLYAIKQITEQYDVEVGE